MSKLNGLKSKLTDLQINFISYLRKDKKDKVEALECTVYNFQKKKFESSVDY